MVSLYRERSSESRYHGYNCGAGYIFIQEAKMEGFDLTKFLIGLAPFIIVSALLVTFAVYVTVLEPREH